MSDLKIALVGAPRSGNRLIQRLLQRHGFVAEVRHYGMRKAFRNGGDQPDFAIWPIRDFDCWRQSCSRDLAILPKPEDEEDVVRTPDELRQIHNERTLDFIAEAASPCFSLSYERLVMAPDSVGGDILAFVGLYEGDWKGWGEEVFDGNAKWKATT